MPKASKPNRQSLAAFVAKNGAHTVGRTCWLCGIPERKEIEAEVAAGTSLPTALRWLREECGYGEDDATDGRMRRHFAFHVKKKST